MAENTAPKVEGTEGDKKAVIFDDSVNDDVLLENMGYSPEFKRSFGLLGMIGFSFSIVTSWTALSGVLLIGVSSGGPPVMIWSWLGICLVSLAVAYSMAEMCSAYPVAGGQYSWVAVLAPKKYARGMSYLCGWFMLIGIVWQLPPLKSWCTKLSISSAWERRIIISGPTLSSAWLTSPTHPTPSSAGIPSW